MRRFSIVAALALVCLAAPQPAHALHWSLGTNLGLTVIDQEGSPDDLTVFSWPNSILTFTPGMRFGLMGEDPRHEFFFDSGLVMLSDDDSSQHLFSASGNYQFNVPAQGNLNVYLTGGLGVFMVGSEFDGPPEVESGGTGVTLGAGVGVKHRMGNGHGALRAEVRFDQLGEIEDDDVTIVPETTLIGLKLGFDLWD